MHKLGTKTLTVHLRQPLAAVPDVAAQGSLTLKNEGKDLEYLFDATTDESGVSAVLQQLAARGIDYGDLSTRQSSLEDIFVGLVHSGDLAETEVQP